MELEVALALAPDGDLFVGTSPDGRIYKVDQRRQVDGAARPRRQYIWSLALDPASNLYAGTGEKGAIYKITPTARARRSTEQGDARHHAGLQPDGQLLAGTESPGGSSNHRTGKAFLLLDSTFQEIHAIGSIRRATSTLRP
jgi:hypothetical protein